MPERAFADFVAHDGDHLRRLAALLEDERDDADELTRGVLVTVRGRWRRIGTSEDPLREARRVMVRRVLGRRPTDGPRSSGWVDDPDAGWDVTPQDDLRSALSELPVPTRVAVVLSLWAGLPDGEVGDLLRAPVDTVRGEVISGLAPLRAALAPVVSPWHVGARLPDDGELRAELTALAEVGSSPADPAETAADAERRALSRRRRRRPIAIAAAAAAIVLAVPALTGRDVPAPQATGPAETSRSPAPAEVDLTGLPTRGSLAGDHAFLDGLLAQPWANDELFGEFPVDITTADDSRRVLYAADVPAGRWALVIGRPEMVQPVDETVGPAFAPDAVVMAWFTGPRGAAPEDMRMSTFPSEIFPGNTPALLDAPTGTLVVLGAPGDAVEVSERVEVNADGSDTRTWTVAAVDDGVVVTHVHPLDAPWAWAVNYRVFRSGDLLVTNSPDSVYPPSAEQVLPDLGVRYPDGPPDPAGRRAAEWAAFIALSSLGTPTDDTVVSARIVAPVPHGEGSVALVTITLPSGAYLVSAQWAWTTEQQFPGGNSCGLDVRPARPPADERLLVASCDMYDPLDGRVLGTELVAAVPPGVATLRLYRGNGTFLQEVTVTGRTMLVPMPAGTRSVEAVTAGGVTLGRSDLLGQWSPTTD